MSVIVCQVLDRHSLIDRLSQGQGVGHRQRQSMGESIGAAPRARCLNLGRLKIGDCISVMDFVARAGLIDHRSEPVLRNTFVAAPAIRTLWTIGCDYGAEFARPAAAPGIHPVAGWDFGKRQLRICIAQ